MFERHIDGCHSEGVCSHLLKTLLICLSIERFLPVLPFRVPLKQREEGRRRGDTTAWYVSYEAGQVKDGESSSIWPCGEWLLVVANLVEDGVPIAERRVHRLR